MGYTNGLAPFSRSVRWRSSGPLTGHAGPRPGERPLSGLELVAASDAAAWDDVVLAADGATPFHSWVFLDGYAANAGLAFAPLLVLRDGVPVGGVPRLVRRLGPLRWVNAGLSF